MATVTAWYVTDGGLRWSLCRITGYGFDGMVDVELWNGTLGAGKPRQLTYWLNGRKETVTMIDAKETK